MGLAWCDTTDVPQWSWLARSIIIWQLNINDSKWLGGKMKTNICHTAQSMKEKAISMIYDFCLGLGFTYSDLRIYKSDCHQHMCNVVGEALGTHLCQKWTQLLKHDLDMIPPNLWVNCSLGSMCHMMGKELNFTANYPKGHSKDFQLLMEMYHPDVSILPAVWVLVVTIKIYPLKGHSQFTAQ